MKIDLRSLPTKILFVILFISLIEPNVIRNVSSAHSALMLMRYVGLLYSFIIFIRCSLFRNRMVLILCGFALFMGFTTLAYNAEFSDYSSTFTVLVMGSILTVYGIKTMPRFFIGMITTIFSLWIFLDGITYSDDGLYLNDNGQKMMFIGTKTSLSYYLFVGICLNFIFMRICSKRQQIYSYVLFGMTILGGVLYLTGMFISTTVMCLTLLVVFYIIVRRKNKASKGVLICGLPVGIVLNFLFIFNVAPSYLSFLIVDYLNEDVTLDGRTQIWDQALGYISQKPILGYGYSSGVKLDVWQEYNTSTHNFYLYMLLTTGVVGLILFMGIVAYVLYKAIRCYNSNIARFCALCIIIINIEAISESCCFNVMFFILLAIVGNINCILPLEHKRRLKIRAK